MRNTVVGQTGSVALSDEGLKRKLSRSRTVRYQYTKVKSGWTAWVCGPFHSRTYGVQSFGIKRPLAKAALQRRLANDHQYLGHTLYSDVDEADNVGVVDDRLLDVGEVNRAITEGVCRLDR